MLDIDLIRNNPELIRESLKNRNYSEKLLDDFLEVDGEWRKAVDESNKLKHERNDASSRIPTLKGDEKQKVIAEMRQVSERIKELDALKINLEIKREDVVLNIPNLPDPSVPIGADYGGNKVVLEWGTPRHFDFEPKKHYELGEDLDIIDFVRGAKITGSGFYIMKGDGARLERALIQYMLDVHYDQGYTEIIPPAIVNKEAVIGTGQYPKRKMICTGVKEMISGSTLLPKCRSPICIKMKFLKRLIFHDIIQPTYHHSDVKQAATLIPAELSEFISSIKLNS